MISHAIILKEKQLYGDSIKVLQKAKKQALENEFFYKQLEINQQLIEIFRESKALTDFNALEELENIRMNNVLVGEQITNAEKYFILSDRLYRKGELLRHTSNNEIKKEIEDLYKDELLQTESKALSKTALVCYHYINYFKFFSEKEYNAKALYHLKSIIDIQELLERFPLRSRFVQMGNYVRLAINSNNEKEAKEMLERMSKIREKEKDNFIQIFYNVQVDYFYLRSKNLKEYLKFHEDLELNIDEAMFSSAVNMEVMDLKHAQFHYHFMKKEFKKAFKIVNFLDNQYNLHSFKNGKFIEKILKIICSYEMGDIDLMASEIRSVKYILQTMEHQPLNKELLAFEIMKDLMKCNNAIDKAKALYEGMQKLEAQQGEEKASFLFDGFRFHLWVKSKFDKKEYIDFVFV